MVENEAIWGDPQAEFQAPSNAMTLDDGEVEVVRAVFDNFGFRKLDGAFILGLPMVAAASVSLLLRSYPMTITYLNMLHSVRQMEGHTAQFEQMFQSSHMFISMHHSAFCPHVNMEAMLNNMFAPYLPSTTVLVVWGIFMLAVLLVWLLFVAKGIWSLCNRKVSNAELTVTNKAVRCRVGKQEFAAPVAEITSIVIKGNWLDRLALRRSRSLAISCGERSIIVPGVCNFTQIMDAVLAHKQV